MLRSAAVGWGSLSNISSIAFERVDVCRDTLGKPVEPISTFEHGDQPAQAEFIGDLHNDARHCSEPLRGNIKLAQQIIAHAVEAGADENEIGFEVARCR